MKNYSQNDEQDFILKHFAGKTDGFFVDVGAGDGVNDSNVRALWELGWNGIFIEANYHCFRQLMEVYGAGERAILIYAAIGDTTGLTAFYEHPITGWSGLTPCLGDSKDYKPRMVMGLKLQDLNLPAQIDFLSIDAEGKDADIVESIPEHVQPKLVMVECDKKWGEERIASFLFEKKGLEKVWTNGVNAAYAARC